LTGDAGRARTLADDLSKRFPGDTIVRFSYLPMLNAQLALHRGDALKAIEALQSTAPYELGGDLHSVYARGEAYLAVHQGSEAAAEFQKIIDHRGIVVNAAIGALAHLGLARAYVLQGDTEKARTKYEDFLTLWKDADPDIPILKRAKAEYAKLHSFRGKIEERAQKLLGLSVDDKHKSDNWLWPKIDLCGKRVIKLIHVMAEGSLTLLPGNARLVLPGVRLLNQKRAYNREKSGAR